MLDESGDRGDVQAEKSPDAAGRLENPQGVEKALNEFENLQGFLEHVTRMRTTPARIPRPVS